MIRNIPNDYTIKQFREELDELGFARCYDFVNFAVDRLSGLSVGYSFVNFISENLLKKAMQVGGVLIFF